MALLEVVRDEGCSHGGEGLRKGGNTGPCVGKHRGDVKKASEEIGK